MVARVKLWDRKDQVWIDRTAIDAREIQIQSRGRFSTVKDDTPFTEGVAAAEDPMEAASRWPVSVVGLMREHPELSAEIKRVGANEERARVSAILKAAPIDATVKDKLLLLVASPQATPEMVAKEFATETPTTVVTDKKASKAA